MSGWAETPFARLLGLSYPIVQAPMAGGPSTPELAVAVSEAGALGSLGLAFVPPDGVREAIRDMRRRTERPFAVNLFVVELADGDVDTAIELLDPLRRELGLPPTNAPRVARLGLEDALAVVLEERPAVFSFTFGTPSADVIQALRESGVRVGGTATTVREAQELERLGVDFVVAQGAEAGGHRGTFHGPFGNALVGTLALVPQVVDAVSVPVLAAGGIMDGRGIAAARVLGAAGAQLGTAFIGCPESGAHAAHKRAVLEGTEEDTLVTAAFTGRPARGFRNRLVRELVSAERVLPPFPLVTAASADVREEGARRGDPELMTLLAGQGLRLGRDLPAAELVAALARETSEALAASAR